MRHTTLISLLLLVPQRAPIAAQNTPALERFTVTADKHPIAVWARRPANATRAILMIHGATWSALPDFDLQVSGEKKSVLAGFAARGYAAYAIDLRGYGGTPRDPSGYGTPRRAAMDVGEVLRWIISQHPQVRSLTLLGWSNGSLVAQLAAQMYPNRLTTLVLYGDGLDPDTRFIAESVLEPAPREKNTDAGARSDFIRPSITSKRTVDAYVVAALKNDPIRAEWKNFEEWNALDGGKVHVPTLLLHGEYDPGTPPEVQAGILAGLDTGDKAWIVLPGGDHAALLEDTRPGFVEVIASFVELNRILNKLQR